MKNLNEVNQLLRANRAASLTQEEYDAHIASDNQSLAIWKHIRNGKNCWTAILPSDWRKACIENPKLGDSIPIIIDIS